MEEVLLYSEDGKTIVGVTDKTVAHISIPSGVERIEDEAFSDCFNLYDVDIADSIIEIGSRSFFRCSSLNSIKLPNGIVKLGEGAFSGCTNLCKIDLPKSLKEIGYAAFNETSWLNEQPEGLVIINDSIYKWKGEMPKDYHLYIPQNVKRIEDYAFDGCYNLLAIDFPPVIYHFGEIEQGITYIGD